MKNNRQQKILDFSEEETMLRKVLLDHAEQSIFLCDSSKIGKNAVFYDTNLDQVDAVICDTEITKRGKDSLPLSYYTSSRSR